MISRQYESTWILIHGKARARLEDGEIEIFGARINAPAEFEVPHGRVLPARVRGRLTLLEGFIEELSESPFPPEWLNALVRIKELARKKRLVVLVLGSVDVGKSSFVLHVSNVLASEGLKVGVVDADIGQAKIGPPAAIKAGILERPVLQLEDVPCVEMYFIGAKTPPGRLLQIVTGVKILADSLRSRCDAVVIDTCGFVWSGPARALKLAQVELVQPDVAVILEAGREMEHIAKVLRNVCEVLRVPRPPKLRPVPREARLELRRAAYERFWQRAKRVRLKVSLRECVIDNAWLGSGVPVNPRALGDGVLWAELGPDFFLAVVRDSLEHQRRQQIVRTMRKLWRHLQAYALALMSGVTPKPPEDLASLCGDRLPEIALMLWRTPMEQVEFQVVPESTYVRLLVGLCDASGRDLGMGIIEHIDWSSGTLEIDAALLRDGAVRRLKLGWLKLDQSFREIGERPIGRG